MVHRSDKPIFVVCLTNRGFEASLVTRRIYRTLPDDSAAARGMLRVIDESAEDYLYPTSLFVPIDVPREVEATFEKAS